MERSIPCEVVDRQLGQVITSLVLPDDWFEQVVQRIGLHDEVARVQAAREDLRGRLKRLGRAFVDGMVDEVDYQRFKGQYEFELAALVIPNADAVAEAGHLVQRLPELWEAANLAERRRLLATILDAVYVEIKNGEPAVRILPKAAFEAVLCSSVEFQQAPALR